MKKIYYSLLLGLLCSVGAQAQTFTDNSIPFEDMFNSGGCVGVCDMNQDGYDDVVILDQSKDLYIQYQNADGSFTTEFYGSVSGSSQWGMSFGDYDQNGHTDVFSGGSYDGAHYISISSPGVYEVIDVEDDSFFMQGCSTADMNNDGWLDVFGCHDDGESKIWGNDGEGMLDPANDWIDMATTPLSDNSGNYGSVFCDVDNDGDVDLFIAKCRQGVNDPEDPRRINALFINDGEGNYTEEALARGLVPYEQSWTVDFADIDNDGDFDCLLTNHSTNLLLFENDGSGYFTDITEGSGLEDETGFFLQAKMADFNNDGFVDLFYAGGLDAYFVNNGDQTFTKFTDKTPADDTMHSFAYGDLNRDGYLDLYSSYGSGYVNPDNDHEDRLWMNDGGDNNFVSFNLTGTESNINAIGAKVEIYGDWGVQIREVRSGESYGIVTTFNCHFGLGTATTIESAVITWPSGLVETLEDVEINTFIDKVEGCDALPEATITATGATVLCNDEEVVLELDTEAANIEWSNGATGNSISVSESGDYYAQVWDDEMCKGTSNHIYIEVYEPSDPTITMIGEENLCEGENIVLTASEGLGYMWSDGSEESTLIVTESGNYSVVVLDECDNELESETLSLDLTFWTVPGTPTIVDQVILPGESATFTVDQENAYWFNSETSTGILGSGATFTTPNLSETTSYWVEYYNGEEAVVVAGGKEEIGTSGQYHDNSSYGLVFTAYEDITIKEVTVYADGEDTRTIEVQDGSGSVIIEEDFLIPDGESVVTLNFQIPAGTNYRISTTGDPQLWRDQSDENLPYPYMVGDVVSIDGTDIGSNNWDNYYYFFYDWKVSSNPYWCAGERVEAQAIIVGVEEINFVTSMTLYPVPANDILNIELESLSNEMVQFQLLNNLGQVALRNDSQSITSGTNTITLDVNDLSAGIYYFQMTFEGKRLNQKVIIK